MRLRHEENSDVSHHRFNRHAGRFHLPTLKHGDRAVMLRRARFIVQRPVPCLTQSQREDTEKDTKQRQRHPVTAIRSPISQMSQPFHLLSFNSAKVVQTSNGDICKSLANPQLVRARHTLFSAFTVSRIPNHYEKNPVTHHPAGARGRRLCHALQTRSNPPTSAWPGLRSSRRHA